MIDRCGKALLWAVFLFGVVLVLPYALTGCAERDESVSGSSTVASSPASQEDQSNRKDGVVEIEVAEIGFSPRGSSDGPVAIGILLSNDSDMTAEGFTVRLRFFDREGHELFGEKWEGGSTERIPVTDEIEVPGSFVPGQYAVAGLGPPGTDSVETSVQVWSWEEWVAVMPLLVDTVGPLAADSDRASVLVKNTAAQPASAIVSALFLSPDGQIVAGSQYYGDVDVEPGTERELTLAVPPTLAEIDELVPYVLPATPEGP